MSKREDGASAHPRSRRLRRLQETQELQVRTTHRRRKLLTRSGVLAGFAVAMVVYPMVGTLTPHAEANEVAQDLATSTAPATSAASALLTGGAALESSDLPLPGIDESATALAASAEYIVSSSLPNCDPSEGWAGYNGKLTDSSLCTLWNGEVVRNDAAVALAELNVQFKAVFGRDLCVGNGYRTLASQYATKRSQGYLAATPGTSVHGWGLAIDLCGSDDTGATKRWLEANGPVWGWENPSWAKSRKWEPWHWEYVPGTDDLGVYESNYWSNTGAYRSSD